MLSLSDITNTDTITGSTETIIVEYSLLVGQDADRDDILTNTAQLDWSDGNTTDSLSVTTLEP